jgi:hypothetical protein
MKSRINKAGVEMVECDACGGMGYDGVEEDTGCAFSCYRCGESGWITKASADAEAAESAAYLAAKDAEVAAERKRLGVPDGYGYYIDEVEGDVVLIPPRVPYKAAPVDYSEDLPF